MTLDEIKKLRELSGKTTTVFSQQLAALPGLLDAAERGAKLEKLYAVAVKLEAAMCPVHVDGSRVQTRYVLQPLIDARRELRLVLSELEVQK